MRIFWWVMGGIAGTVAVAALLWLAGERVVMFMAVRQLKQDIATVRQTAVKGSGVGSCESSLVMAYQLRFTSETSYVTETVCEDGMPGNILSEKKLPGGVRRLYGSGVQFPVKNTEIADTWVHLQYKELTVTVGYFNGAVGANWQPKKLTIGGASPAQAHCADWGFSCCNDGTETGEGYMIQTNDCSSSCFQTCNQRPVVLFFNADPLIDTASREVLLFQTKATVTFGYEIADYDGTVSQVAIDFGDNQTSPVLSAKETAVTHDYICRQARCVYQAWLLANDNKGNLLAESKTQMIRIVMQPR